MLPATSWNGRWDDGWFTQDEEGCWWSHAETRSHAETQLWLDIEEVMGLAFFPPKGKGKRKKCIQARGQGNSKGKGKGKQTPGKPNFTGCSVCGSKQHDYRNCPNCQAGSQQQGSGKRTREFSRSCIVCRMPGASARNRAQPRTPQRVTSKPCAKHANNLCDSL